MTKGSTVLSASARRLPLAAVVIGLAIVGPVIAHAQVIDYSMARPENAQRNLTPIEAVSPGLLSGFYPAINFGVTYENNIFRTPDDEKADTRFTVAPSLLFKEGPGGALGRHSFQLGIAATFNQYDTFSDEDYVNWGVDAGFLFDVTSILDWDVYAGYGEGAEQRGASGARVDPLREKDEFQRTRVGTGVTLGRRTNTLQLRAGVEQEEIEFTNNDQTGRDRDRDTFFGSVFYNYSPRTQFLFDVQRYYYDYLDPRSLNDSTTTNYSLGVNYQTSALTNLHASVGYSDREYDDTPGSDTDATVYALRWTWQARPRTNLRVYGSRGFEESAEVGSSQEYIHTLVGVGATQQLTGRLILNAFANLGNDEFGSGRDEDIFDTAIGLIYAIRPWVSLSGMIGHVERSSNDPLVEYDAEYASLYVTFRRP